MSVTASADFDLHALPSTTETATMLGVNKSTISKRARLSESVNGKRRIPPSEVLRLAMEQRKVPVTQVAQSLIDYAERHAPSSRPEVERQVREFFAADRERPKPQVTREEFLGQARELLDDRAYAELESRYDAAYGRRPATHLVSAYDGIDA